MKKSQVFPLNGKNKKKIYFFSVNTKNILSHVLKISAISLVLRTREITDIFNTFNGIHLKKVNILFLIQLFRQEDCFYYDTFKLWQST